MVKCSTCGAYTALYFKGVPICLDCERQREIDARKTDEGVGKADAEMVQLEHSH